MRDLIHTEAAGNDHARQKPSRSDRDRDLSVRWGSRLVTVPAPEGDLSKKSSPEGDSPKNISPENTSPEITSPEGLSDEDKITFSPGKYDDSYEAVVTGSGKSGSGTPLPASGKSGKSRAGTSLPADCRSGKSGSDTPLPASGKSGKSGSGTSLPSGSRSGKSGSGTSLPAGSRSGKSRAILAGCNTGMPTNQYTRTMAELRGLAKACDLEVAASLVQNAAQITHATYLGSGKVAELKQEVERLDADIVLFNEALTPMQMRNLEKELDTEVLDRTGLILQIFATRAKTREAKLQVESAQLAYMLPRLVGMRASLSRQGGGSGRLSNKGAGEQKLELDRRRIEQRMARLRRELEVVEQERDTQRSRRGRTGLTRVALVGYTNAGKSTIMNALLDYSFSSGEDFTPGKNYSSGKDSVCSFGETAGAISSAPGMQEPPQGTEAKRVFEADMLFATLDTSVRRIDAPGHLPFLLSDTVGFVSDLPHTLVRAFRSTLDEVRYADLLLEVVDFSDPDFRRQIEVTAKTLEEIGAGHIPVVYLYNKTDLVLEQHGIEKKDRPVPVSIPFRRNDILYLAAGRKTGIPDILTLIDDALSEDRMTARFLFPYTKGGLCQDLRTCGVILREEYTSEGIRVLARLRRTDAGRFRDCLEA